MTLSPTERSTVRRGKHRAVTDRAALYAVLDAGLICHLAFVADGAPVVLPTGYGRDGNTLYLHGSTGASSLRVLGAGADVCVGVTLLDGVVYARAVFHNSVNYRSAVVHGRPSAITEPGRKLHALRVITEHLAPGSWSHARQPTKRELAKTAVFALDLTEAAVKIRTGPPVDEDEDVAEARAWAGVLPLRRSWGEIEPCPLLPDGTPTPPHVRHRD
ncbi:MAG: pyridoxamine 5'-phosphate oxidase family protein [Pseudonocardiaceae bacterium]|nr:pyridoxamine 5'-phosphate oxidase family protein [Pseudonocardiaceae bacterium]